jgi:heme-degrading monooxygenase HmoA
MTDHHLAQFNIGRLCAPLDTPAMAGFRDALQPVNALADAAPGFVWRLVDEGGQDATGIRPHDDDMIVNLSVWESREALWNFTYRSEHLDFLRRRREWFARVPEPFLVLWWVPAGHVPAVEEGFARLDRLREAGPGPEAFTFRQSYDPAGALTGA